MRHIAPPHSSLFYGNKCFLRRLMTSQLPCKAWRLKSAHTWLLLGLGRPRLGRVSASPTSQARPEFRRHRPNHLPLALVCIQQLPQSALAPATPLFAVYGNGQRFKYVSVRRVLEMKFLNEGTQCNVLRSVVKQRNEGKQEPINGNTRSVAPNQPAAIFLRAPPSGRRVGRLPA